ncbi:hypothetical protein ABH945_003229 [Paraburkholderia sp. GAS333]
MKSDAIFYALCATAMLSSSAMAQNNPPSSSQGLNAGDNVQSAPAHKSSSHAKKMKPSKGETAGNSTQPGGTATPSGPGAPVSASGSGS